MTFVNLAETLNFSKTAVNLNISQSSVSQAIASIEKQLGVTLFYRSRKAVSLTPAGQEFYDRVKPWLNEYNKAVQHVQQVQNAQKMNLTIGYSGTPYEHTVVPELVRAFCQEHPQINVFLENYAHQELKGHLTHGNCDVIFTMPDIIAGMDNLAYHSLLIGYYCLIRA
ncbi:LysR family transcriptional regulator [Lactobacillus delbrueckii subsp. bulgaricus]